MGEVTGIAWTDHTWSPWRGCSRVSEGCRHCYAETLANRFPQVHGQWGVAAAGGTRVVASAESWRGVMRWDAAAKRDGKLRTVFPSMCDPFDTHPVAVMARPWLWELVRCTPHLMWLLLTKRPENIASMVPDAWRSAWPHNVAIGTTVENMAVLDQRCMDLLSINAPASQRFLSVEPMLEELDFRQDWHRYLDWVGMGAVGDDRHTYLSMGIGWVICGGESGPRARPFNLAWARSLKRQCTEEGVPFFFKQMGARPVGLEHFTLGAVLPNHPAGADPAEFPVDLRVQQFPAWRTL